jgi:hypothetical protein
MGAQGGLQGRLTKWRETVTASSRGHRERKEATDSAVINQNTMIGFKTPGSLRIEQKGTGRQKAGKLCLLLLVILYVDTR